MKKVFCLLAAALFCLSLLPVRTGAAGGISNFKRTAAYKPFSDVPENSWYRDNVAAVCEFGLMNGKDADTFDPDGLLTVAEAVTIAARVHAAYYGKTIPSLPTAAHWYDMYVRYAVGEGIADYAIPEEGQYADYYEAQMGRQAARSLFASLISNALPDEALKAVNRVEDGGILDLAAASAYTPAVYRLYRAGILTGSTGDGRVFLPEDNIKRSEIAAMVSRVADPSLRRSITVTKWKDTGTVRLNAGTGVHSLTVTEHVNYSGYGSYSDPYFTLELSPAGKAAYPKLDAWIQTYNAETTEKYEADMEEWVDNYLKQSEDLYLPDGSVNTSWANIVGMLADQQVSAAFTVGRFDDSILSFSTRTSNRWFQMAGGSHWASWHGFAAVNPVLGEEIVNILADQAAFDAAFNPLKTAAYNREYPDSPRKDSGWELPRAWRMTPRSFIACYNGWVSTGNFVPEDEVVLRMNAAGGAFEEQYRAVPEDFAECVSILTEGAITAEGMANTAGKVIMEPFPGESSCRSVGSYFSFGSDYINIVFMSPDRSRAYGSFYFPTRIYYVRCGGKQYVLFASDANFTAKVFRLNRDGTVTPGKTLLYGQTSEDGETRTWFDLSDVSLYREYLN